MAHFAKIGMNGKVLNVHVVNDSDCLNADGIEDEAVGQEFLERLHGWPREMWIKTSIGTKEGKHYTFNEDGTRSLSADQTKAFRGNYAGIGMIWDDVRNMFIESQPVGYSTWVLNETTGRYEAPAGKTRPTVAQVQGAGPGGEDINCVWDDTNARWAGTGQVDRETLTHYWDNDTNAWVAL